MRSVRFTVFLVCVALWLLAGAAGASENVPESVLLREWPELKNAAAPFWLKEGVRLTYESASTPVSSVDELWEESSERRSAPRELPDSAGRDYTEVSVVGERRLPLRGASDDRTAPAGQPERAPVKALTRSMLVEYREMSFPWTYDLPPSWTEEFHSATFAGSITAALPGTTSLPFQTSSVMTVTTRGRRWFLYRTQDTTAALSEIPPGVAMRDGERISGIAQVGGLWIPPMGFTRLRQGQTIDTAPVTGAKITVAAVDDAFVTLREQAAGYSADYWYDRTSGALSHVRFVDRAAGQVVDQKRTH